MATRAELVYLVAQMLRKVIAGDPLGNVEYAAIDTHIPYIVAGLVKRGVIYISYIEEIEDEIMDPLARVIAAKVGVKFGMTLASIPGFEGEPVRSEMELRALGRDTNASDVIRAQNF
jgi:hypothetical protein